VVPQAGVHIFDKVTALGISAWPDPVTDNLQMEVKNSTGNNISLHVVLTDNLGKTIIDQLVQSGSNSDMTRIIDMSALAKGLYFLSVTDNASVLHKQTIIKQ